MDQNSSQWGYSDWQMWVVDLKESLVFCCHEGSFFRLCFQGHVWFTAQISSCCCWWVPTIMILHDAGSTEHNEFCRREDVPESKRNYSLLVRISLGFINHISMQARWHFMTFVLLKLNQTWYSMLIRKWNKGQIWNLELDFVFQLPCGLICLHIFRKADGAGPRVPLWTGCCWWVSGADIQTRCTDMKRADWWQEAG